MDFPLITDWHFYAIAIPAVVLLGISKSGFGAGFGSLAVPLMALVVTVPQAAAILMPVLLVMDLLGMAAYRKDLDRTLLKFLIPCALVGTVVGTLLFKVLDAKLVAGLTPALRKKPPQDLLDQVSSKLTTEHLTRYLSRRLEEVFPRAETLEDYLEKRGPMPPALIRTILQHLADALDQAHQAGVVHRDLKPSNLFLTTDRKGEPQLKVMDFGIAKVLEQEVQRTATQIGTPSYAAPEQMGPTLRRLAERQGITLAAGVSPTTDIWAMGLLIFELFTALPTGHFWGVESLAELPAKVALEEAEPATVRAGDRAHLLPPGFDAWLARCTRKNAAERRVTVTPTLSPGRAGLAVAGTF